MAEAGRDGNQVTTMLALSSADGTTPVPLKADPATGRLLVDLSGGVTGPGTSTDNAIARYDGTGGSTLKDSSVLIDDTDNITGVATINKITITQPASGATLTIQDGFTLTIDGSATVQGTNTGDQTTISGNAGTATALETARTINGVSFDGTANIVVTAAAGTLTGTVLNSTVVTSSLTAVGTLTTLTVDDITINANTISSAGASSLTITATVGQAVAVEGVLFDGGVVTGASSITSTTFVGALTGNADTVTTNANLTGIVTSVGNATAIADKAIAIAKLADGTDGELITWSATGVIETVAVGTATHVLTSNGVGVAPTFQAAAGGGADLVVMALPGIGEVGTGTSIVQNNSNAWRMNDNTNDTNFQAPVKAPVGATSISSVKLLVNDNSSGDAFMRFFFYQIDRSDLSAEKNDTTDTNAAYTGTASGILVITVPTAAYSGLTIGEDDILNIRVFRDSDDASDTWNTFLDVFGIEFTFA